MRTLVLVEHPLTAPCLRVRHLLLLGRPAGHLLLRLHHLLPELHIDLADDVRLCGKGRESEADRVMRAKERGRGWARSVPSSFEEQFARKWEGKKRTRTARRTSKHFTKVTLTKRHYLLWNIATFHIFVVAQQNGPQLDGEDPPPRQRFFARRQSLR